jgi:transcriptional regulator with XRE-family HTH domain
LIGVNDYMPKLEHNTKSMNKLSQFLRLIMQQKGLKAIDIERKCDKKISNSYIGKILRGEITNITIETIDALAEGLDIDAYELFAIAYDKPRRGSIPAVDSLLLIETMQKIVMNPQLLEVLDIWVNIEPRHQAALLPTLKAVSVPKRKIRKKR